MAPTWDILGLGPGEFTRTDAGVDNQQNEVARDGGLTRTQGRDSEAGIGDAAKNMAPVTDVGS